MTKVVVNPNLPFFDRDSFLTPFDKMFDQMIETQFPNVVQQVGVKPYQGTIQGQYTNDDKIGLLLEILALRRTTQHEVEDLSLRLVVTNITWDDFGLKFSDEN